MATTTREKVRAMLEAGLSMATIATTLGISKPTVCYHKRKLGYEINPRFGHRYDWPAVQHYYDLGHSRRDCQVHFGFSAWAWTYAIRRGAITPRPVSMPLDELLAIDTPRNRNHIKLRLLAVGLKENRCEECGISKWRDRSLTLALHHINGDGDDNRLENLQLLCPNCHSQTPNFSGRNIRREAA